MPAAMLPIATPPYYGSPIWPIVFDTQGGPAHVELDHGIRPLDLGQLRSAAGHKVDESYIRYHKERIHYVLRAR